MSRQTYYDYISGFEKLMIIEDTPAWNPSIRSKTSIRSSKKRNFVDPSIAAAALGVAPEYFSKDYKTLGFLFECLCIRDLKIYSSAKGGRISYYHDRMGLEANAVLHLEDGRYALIEIKLGQTEVDEGAEHLNKIERLIKYKKEGKEIAELEKDLQETKKYYLETKENLKDLNKIKIEIAKDYYKMGVNIDILSRYAHLTPKEIKEIENY